MLGVKAWLPHKRVVRKRKIKDRAIQQNEVAIVLSMETLGLGQLSQAYFPGTIYSPDGADSTLPGSFMAKDPKNRSFGGFLRRKPERKPVANSIAFEHTSGQPSCKERNKEASTGALETKAHRSLPQPKGERNRVCRRS